MPAVKDPHAVLLKMITDTKAELLVTQAALAVALSELAKLSPDPRNYVADAEMRILVMGHAVGEGMAGSETRPEAMSGVADRIANWAEMLVREKVPAA